MQPKDTLANFCAIRFLARNFDEFSFQKASDDCQILMEISMTFNERMERISTTFVALLLHCDICTHYLNIVSAKSVFLFN